MHWLTGGLALLLAGCGWLQQQAGYLPPLAEMGGQMIPPPYTDASPTMAGICFEAAHDAAGQVFILRSAAELERFYDLADASGLCRRPVARPGFDFTGGQALAGLWSAGVGCTARHEALAFTRDDAARVIELRLRFVTEGDCPYELVRPLWIGLAGAEGYSIALVVENPDV